MRILAIRGANLASLAGPFGVELDSGALGAAGVFAITGPTGAGKSTLLDAMCLALFGKTPRSARGGDARVGAAEVEADDRLTAKDARGLLHRGAPQGHAECEFEGLDGGRYLARWEVKRARNKVDGRLQDATSSLRRVSDGAVLGATTSETRAAVVERLGLSFDQFRRSVLLAQGEFAAFLHATDKERAELLEKVTRTEIYAEISRRSFERARQAKVDLDAVDRDRKALAVLSDAERAEKEAERASLATEVRGRREQVRVAEAAVAWFAEAERLERGRAGAEVALARARAAIDEGAPRRAELQRVRAVQRHLGALRELDEAALRLPVARQEAQDRRAEERRAGEESAKAVAAEAAARATWEAARVARDAASPALERAGKLDARLDDAGGGLKEAARLASEKAALAAEREAELASAVARASAARRALDDGEAWLAAREGDRALAEGWDRIEGAVAGWAAAAIAVAEGARAEATARDALGRALAAGEVASEASRLAEASLARAAGQAKAAEDAVEAGAREGLAVRREAVEAWRELAERAVAAAEGAASARSALGQASGEVATARARASAASAVSSAAQAELPVARARADEARQARDLARSAMDLAAHREALVDGEPCPLCGAAEHPWSRGGAPVVDGLEARVNALEGEVRRLELAVVDADGQQRAEARAGDLAAARQREAEEGLGRHEAAWRDVAGLLGLADAGPFAWGAGAARALQRARDEQKAVAEAESALTGKERAAEAARKARDGARVTRDAAVKAEREAAESARSAVEALTACENDRQRAAYEQEVAWTGLTSAWPGGAAEREAFAAGPERVVAGWRQRADGWRSAALRVAEARELLGTLGPRVAGAEVSARAAADVAAEAASQRDAAAAVVAALRAERAGLLGGRSVGEARAALDAAAKLAEERYTAAQAASGRAALAVTKAAAAREEGQRRLEEALRRQEVAGEAVRAVLTTEGIELAALRALLARDAGWIAAEVAALDALDAASTEAHTLLVERQRQEAEHARARPSEPDAGAAAMAAASAEQALQAALDAAQAVHVALAQDDAGRERGVALLAEFERAREVAELWGGVSDVIGAADGTKFRKFAQGLTLDALLVEANAHLGALAPRYQLQRVPGSDLDLQVVDRHMGDEIRGVPSLSGGETFLASLALALGLATTSAATTPVGSLFIDEGFGTLDRQTLEAAMAALDALQAQGRQVGIISHVEGLADLVGVQVQVVKGAGGRSVVVSP